MRTYGLERPKRGDSNWSFAIMLTVIGFSASRDCLSGEDAYTALEVEQAKADFEDVHRAEFGRSQEKSNKPIYLEMVAWRYFPRGARVFSSSREVLDNSPRFLLRGNWFERQREEKASSLEPYSFYTRIGDLPMDILTEANDRRWILDTSIILAFETLNEAGERAPPSRRHPTELYNLPSLRNLDSDAVNRGVADPKFSEILKKNRSFHRTLRAHLPGQVNIYFRGDDPSSRKPTFRAVVLGRAVQLLDHTFATVEKDGAVSWLINTNCTALENLDKPSPEEEQAPVPSRCLPKHVNVYFTGDKIAPPMPSFAAVAVRGEVEIFGRTYVEIEDAQKTRWLINPSGAAFQDAVDDETLKQRKESELRLQAVMQVIIKQAEDAAKASGEKDPAKLKALRDLETDRALLQNFSDFAREQFKQQGKTPEEIEAIIRSAAPAIEKAKQELDRRK